MENDSFQSDFKEHINIGVSKMLVWFSKAQNGVKKSFVSDFRSKENSNFRKQSAGVINRISKMMSLQPSAATNLWQYTQMSW